MPTDLEELIPDVDEAIAEISLVGYYMRDVSILKRTWSGERISEGTPAAPAVVQLITPRPKVLEASMMPRLLSAGIVESGDLRLFFVSATLSEAVIRGTLYEENEELLYRVEKVADTIEAAVPEATTGLFRLKAWWRRPHPMGWTLTLSPIVS